MPNFIEIEETFYGRTDVRTHVRTHVRTCVRTSVRPSVRTDGLTNGHLRTALLGRLCRRVGL